MKIFSKALLYCFLLFRQTEHQLKARDAPNLHFAACFLDTLTQHGKTSALYDFSLWRRAVVGQGNLHAVRLLPKAHIQFCTICVTDAVRRTLADRQCAQCAYPLPLRRIPCQQNANAQFFHPTLSGDKEAACRIMCIVDFSLFC